MYIITCIFATGLVVGNFIPPPVPPCDDNDTGEPVNTIYNGIPHTNPAAR